MTLGSLIIISIVMVGSAVLIVILQRSAEKDLYQSFEHNVNLSFCTMRLKNNSNCNSFDFQLDYRRHADHNQYLNYLSLFLLSTMRLFSITSQPNYKIFFGTLKFNNNNTLQTVAKVAGYYYSSKLNQTINSITNIDSTVLKKELNLILPFNEIDDHSLYTCSKDDINSYPLKYKILYSVINDKNSNDLQLWLEAWFAIHLNAEPIILKMLNGYRFAPELYGTCGHVNFVENCGNTLQYHYHKLNLGNRLLIAKELLKLALELTDGTAHPNYSFYLTDLTADNIAIQLNETSGSLQSLKVIDWSDVILVIKDNGAPTEDNLLIHVSEHIDCGLGCLIYSKEEICRASVSDHNVYAVCKEFLSTGGKLLYEITDLDHSKQIQEKEVQELRSLMRHCLLLSDVQWNSKKSRLDTAKSIIKTIEHIFQQGIKYK